MSEKRAQKKRVEIVKVPVMGTEGTPIEVDGKACTKCGEVKALTEFGVEKRTLSGACSSCYECNRKYNAERRKRANPSGQRRKPTLWTTESLGAFVAEVTDGEYMLVGEYRRVLDHVEMRHTTCGESWSVKPHEFISHGRRCPPCAVKLVAEAKRKKHTEFQAEIHTLVGDEYTVLGDYENCRTPVLVRHNICGHEYDVRPTDLLSAGNRCPSCAASKGETRVAAYLEARGHVFTREYPFDDCRDNRPLPFDFAVHHVDALVVIEYDGEHHFQPVVYSGDKARAERQFRDRKRKDRIKTDYCRANGIPLIRIDYTQFDEIETILDRELSALGCSKPQKAVRG